MIRRYKKVAVLLLLPIFLTGCWDYKDVNKRDVIISIGVDDVNGEVEITGEAAKLLSNSSQQNKGIAQLTEVYKYKSTGKHFEEVRAKYDSNVPFPYFAGAIRAIVFSKKYAEGGIRAYINRLYHVAEFRNSVLVSISKESTNDLFSHKIENDICIGYAVEDTIKYLDDNGAALYKTVQEVKSDVQFKNIGYLLPYITSEENTIKYLGLAAMKDSKLVGIIKREESNGFLFVLSKRPVMVNSFPNPSDEKNLIAIKTTLGKRGIKTNYEDGKINIYIDLKLKSQLQYEYNIEPLSKEDIEKVENSISDQIKENIISATKRSQNEFKSDVFGFARYFKAENPKEYKQINWEEEYPKAVFHVNVDTTILNTNLFDPNAKKTD